MTESIAGRWRAGGCCWCSTTASTSSRRPPTGRGVLARRTVKVLATSREGLRLSGEHIWPVPSLDVEAASARRRSSCSSNGRAAVAPSSSSSRPTKPTRWRRSAAPRRHRTCHRAGRRAHGLDEPPRGMRPPPDRFRLLAGSRRLERHRRFATPCSGPTTCSTGTSGRPRSLRGVRRWLRPDREPNLGGDFDEYACWTYWNPWCASRWSPRPGRRNPLRDAGDDPSVRGGPARRPRR